MIHISEIANKYISNITKYVNVGENIYAKVIDYDSDNYRLKLSIKGLNYKEVYLNRKVQESVRGFSPLQENLDKWISDKIKENIEMMKELGVPVKYVSIGPDRDQTITRNI